MKKILFLRDLKKIHGGHIKFRDYFLHALKHPGVDSYVYFTPDSIPQGGDLYAEAPRDRFVAQMQIDDYDAVFIAGGKNWKMLPENLNGTKIINLIQDFDNADPEDAQFANLKRKALRICVSEQVYDAVAPHAAGETVMIKYGIPLDVFSDKTEKRPNSIFIWARKNKTLGKSLALELQKRDHDVTLLKDFVPRTEFARILGESDIFVALCFAREGFYLPALEGMARRCAVLCSDAIGNRSFCVHHETCLMPEHDHFDSHLAMIEQLLADADLKTRLQQRGYEMAQTYAMHHERENLHRVLDEYVVNSDAVKERHVKRN